jgi:hypothetical protein
MSDNEPFELAEDRDFISGIYDYCDRWCEKCPFTSRCRVYSTEAEGPDLDDPEVHDINNAKFWRKLESIFQEAHEKIAAWAEEAGVDLDPLDDEAIALHDEQEKEADEHQLSELARQYAMTVQEWFADEFAADQNARDNAVLDAEGAPDIGVAGAAEVIRWYQFFVAAKVIRALMGRSQTPPLEASGDDDPFPDSVDESIDDLEEFSEVVRDDGNGSAKIALIAIDRSTAAWHAMEMCLPTKSDSIALVFAQLERLRWLLEQEFPDAREFIRPGFDETESGLVN